MSLTVVEKGDIVYLVSDGISDNFDPVVGKFAEVDTKIEVTATTSSPKTELFTRQNKIGARLQSFHADSSSGGKLSLISNEDPVHVIRGSRLKLATSSISNKTNRPIIPKYSRSQTLIEPRHIAKTTQQKRIKNSMNGMPIISPQQRHVLTLLRMEDLFRNGMNRTFGPCTTAKSLCNLLIEFSKKITLAKRKLLEQRELFWKVIYEPNGQRKEVELSRTHQQAARKRMIDSHFKYLSGKLDHASVIAWSPGQ